MSRRPDATLATLIQLLRERSLQTGDFTLSSGRKSPYYIDARTTTMSSAGLDLIGKLGLGRIRTAKWDADRVGGLTLGADPVAYAIALASRDCPPILDAFTVRKRAKTHGKGRLIEGCFAPGDATVIVEDVITTGGSALQAAEAVREAGGVVVGVLAVVDRGEGGAEAIETAGFPVQSIVSVRDLDVTEQAT